MPYVKKGGHGGKRAGAGHSLRFRYKPGKAFSSRHFRMGQLCMALWRATDNRATVLHYERKEPLVVELRLGKVGKRPRTRKQIISYVAKKFGEKDSIVEKCWDDYRDRWEPDLLSNLNSTP